MQVRGRNPEVADLISRSFGGKPVLHEHQGLARGLSQRSSHLELVVVAYADPEMLAGQAILVE